VHRGIHKGKKIETDRYPLRHIARFVLIALYTGTRAGAVMTASLSPGPGKSFIDPNNIKDTLSLSLGRDKRIVVKREKQKELTSRKLIGTNQKESYAWEISVRNTKSEPIRISIEDQIPVSQNSQIEVTATEIGGSISISVSDNGAGVADSIRDRLFHPFVSHGKENGTGLGLAVVQKIVQDHGGEISVERTARSRTVFTILLPGRLLETFRSANGVKIDVPSLVPAPREAGDNSISHPDR